MAREAIDTGRTLRPTRQYTSLPSTGAGGMARLEGFEPPTNGFGSHYSIRLSYRRLAEIPAVAAEAIVRAGLAF